MAGPVGRRQGYNCNLGTPDFLVAGPVGRRQGYKCNLGTRDFLVAGPVGRRQGYNCNLGTCEYLVAGPVGRRQGYNCNLGTRDSSKTNDTSEKGFWKFRQRNPCWAPLPQFTFWTHKGLRRSNASLCRGHAIHGTATQLLNMYMYMKHYMRLKSHEQTQLPVAFQLGLPPKNHKVPDCSLPTGPATKKSRVPRLQL